MPSNNGYGPEKAEVDKRRSFIVDQVSGKNFPREDLLYLTPQLVLIVEDNEEQRVRYEAAAHRQIRLLGKEPLEERLNVAVASNTEIALEHLGKLYNYRPRAQLYLSLDYNMAEADPGQRKPTEALFIDPIFQHFLDNGGAGISYSGFIDQVKQSIALHDIIAGKPNFAYGLAEKGQATEDDVFGFLVNVAMHPSQAATYKKILALPQVGYDIMRFKKFLRLKGQIKARK